MIRALCRWIAVLLAPCRASLVSQNLKSHLSVLVCLFLACGCTSQVPSAAGVEPAAPTEIPNAEPEILAEPVSSALPAQPWTPTKDPFEIQRRIVDGSSFDDITPLWQSLGISPELDTIYSRVGLEANPSDRFERCNGRCIAEIANANLDDAPDQELILKIYQQWGGLSFSCVQTRASFQQSRVAICRPR